MGNSTARLLLIGLDNAGKSTILARILEPDEAVRGITPTIGFKKDTFTRCGIDFEVLDMSGQSKYRQFWIHQASLTQEKERIQGVIFVIDSSDKMRIRVAKSELDLFLDNQKIPKNLPFLFFANKSDIKGAAPLQEVKNLMQLQSLSKLHFLVSCSGTTGRGVQQGIDWLCNHVKLVYDSRS